MFATNTNVQKRVFEEETKVCPDITKINHVNLSKASISETLRIKPAATVHANSKSLYLIPKLFIMEKVDSCSYIHI